MLEVAWLDQVGIGLQPRLKPPNDERHRVMASLSGPESLKSCEKCQNGQNGKNRFPSWCTYFGWQVDSSRLANCDGANKDRNAEGFL